jgi:hypothetical protein
VQLTVVFAQLHTLGKWEGVHAFAVRIRDDQLKPMQGVRIRVGVKKRCSLQLWQSK